jgi:LuxR family maltose regulon positive regulatory protein
LSFVSGDLQSFAPWLKAGDMEQSDILYQGMGFNYIVYAQSVLLEKNFIKLEVLCEEMLQLFSMFNNLLGFLHTYILSTVAKYNLYGMEKAKAAILQALDIGRADQIILPFAEYGMYVTDVLKELQKENRSDEYLSRLAAALEEYREKLKHYKDEETQSYSFTGRELEVLKLVVEGKTNKEIGATLFIAEVTVSKNITSIYQKLGVTGRSSAVKRAMELKII